MAAVAFHCDVTAVRLSSRVYSRLIIFCCINCRRTTGGHAAGQLGQWHRHSAATDFVLSFPRSARRIFDFTLAAERHHVTLTAPPTSLSPCPALSSQREKQSIIAAATAAAPTSAAAAAAQPLRPRQNVINPSPR